MTDNALETLESLKQQVLQHYQHGRLEDAIGIAAELPHQALHLVPKPLLRLG